MLKIFLYSLCSAVFLGIFSVQARVNVAVVAPRVGDLKVFGDELVNGVQIAVDDINAQGGIEGESVSLLVVDDQCKDTFAISTAQMMAVNASREKINLVIGPYCDNAFDKVADIYARANIFQIVPTSIGKNSNARHYEGLVKMVAPVDKQGEDFFNYYEANFNGKRVALAYDASVREVVEIAAAVQNEFRHHGQAERLMSYNIDMYRDSLSKMARRIVKDDNDVVYILGTSNDISKLSRELKDEKEDLTLFTNRYQARQSYREMLGDLAEGTYMVALPSLKNSPDFTETLVRLRLQGAEPEGLGVYGYSAIKLWRDLVDKADSFKYEDLVATLNNNTFVTPWGETMFTNGTPEKQLNYGIYKFQDGEYTQVY